MQKLEAYYGFTSSAINSVKSYLENKYQRVIIGDASSELVLIISDVLQGYILGPILFRAIINNLVSCCVHLYADSGQIYLPCPLGLVENQIQRINGDLERSALWFDCNGLKINSSKTKAITIPPFLCFTTH